MDFSELAQANSETFGEDGYVVPAAAERRQVKMTVHRHALAPVPEDPAQQQARFTVEMVDSATLGATHAEIDLGTWKLDFADVPGGTILRHDIGRPGNRVQGFVIVEIFGAGYAIP